MADNQVTLDGKTPDRYLVKKLIGQGAYGKVYKVLDSQDGNKILAMKLVEKTRADNVVRSAQIERDLMLGMEHKNVVGVHDHFENEHYVGMLLSYCPYGDLYNLCHKKAKVRKFTQESAAHILKQCMEALAYVHGINLVHGDLKPENILIKDIKTMSICITDFGLSQHRQRMTWLKKRCGSPLFMAPEKFDLHTSEASDIWAIGIIGFEMIFGYVPWEAKNCKEQQQILKNNFENIIQKGKGPWFPKDILTDNAREFIYMLLQYDPGNRLTAMESLCHPFLTRKKKSRKKRKKKKGEDPEEPPAEPLTPEKLNMNKQFQIALDNGAKLNKFRKLVGTFMLRCMPPVALEMIHKDFQGLDSADDGRISLEHFMSAFTGRSDLSESQLQLIFESLDMKGKGSVSYEQIMSDIAYHHLSTQDDRIVEFYKACSSSHKVINMEKLLALKKENPHLPAFESSFSLASFKEVWQETLGEESEISRNSFHKNLFDFGEFYSGSSTTDSI